MYGDNLTENIFNKNVCNNTHCNNTKSKSAYSIHNTVLQKKILVYYSHRNLKIKMCKVWPIYLTILSGSKSKTFLNFVFRVQAMSIFITCKKISSS
jgi:hypothetical protein